MAAEPATMGALMEVPDRTSSSQVGPVPPELETERTYSSTARPYEQSDEEIKCCRNGFAGEA